MHQALLHLAVAILNTKYIFYDISAFVGIQLVENKWAHISFFFVCFFNLQESGVILPIRLTACKSYWTQ